MANNIVLLPTAGDAGDPITLSAVTTSVISARTQYGNTGSATYTGTITGGANNGLAKQALTISGFTNAQNNGTFTVLFSTATTLLLNNTNAIAETHAATASYGTQGTPSQYSSKVSNLIANNQGDNISVNCNGGETLVAVAIGLKSLWPFDQLHGTAPYPIYNWENPSSPTTTEQFNFGQLQGLNDFNANPTIGDNSLVTPDYVTAALGTAANYSLLAYSGITNTGASVITGGNVGSYPTATITPGGWTLTPPAVVDETHAAAAQGATLGAYNTFLALPVTQTLTTADMGTQSGGGAPTGHYYPGVYKSGSSLDIATAITLDGQGNTSSLFVFEAGSTISQAIAGTITLINGAQAQNVVWIAGSSFTSVGPGSVTVGNIIAVASITLGGGSLNGRALAMNGAVTISAAENVTVPSIGGSINTWSLIANIDLVDSDYGSGPLTSSPPAYTPGPNPPSYRLAVVRNGVTTYIYYTPPPTVPAPATNPWPSSKWSIDGYYPSLYVWVATDVNAGTYDVNLNSVYQNGILEPLDLAAGKPIFDGGANFQVFKLNGTGAVESSFSIGTSSANPATAPAPITTTAADGDILISVGMMKSGNTFAVGNTGGTPVSLTLTSVAPLQYGTGSQYPPQNYGGAVYTGTITGGANNAFVGYQFTVTGFLDGVTGANPNGYNNGVFNCTASTATTLTLSNGAAISETHAGTAAYVAPMTQLSNGALVGSEAHYMVEYALTAPGSAGSFNPGFSNPLGYEMVVASIAIKSS
jgi:Ice-binding-like